MAYSAATPATDRNASFTRASNPGLSGAKGVNISLAIPAASAARKIRLRRIRNCDAATGSPKSATSTAHALSYAAHSGDSVSGVSVGRVSLLGISLAFPCVGSSQRYNAQPIIPQNINENVQPPVQQPARDETFFGVVVPVVQKDLSGLPVEPGRIREVQAALGKVLRGFGVVPLNLPSHLFAPNTTSGGTSYHERKSLSKLYIPVWRLWISSMLCQTALWPLYAASVRLPSNPNCGQLTGSEAANA